MPVERFSCEFATDRERSLAFVESPTAAKQRDTKRIHRNIDDVVTPEHRTAFYWSPGGHELLRSNSAMEGPPGYPPEPALVSP